MGRATKKTPLAAEIIGWYGAFAIMSAYVLVSFNIVSASSITYQLLNLTGALGLIVIAVAKDVHQTIVINAFWALIAVIALGTLVVKSL